MRTSMRWLVVSVFVVLFGSSCAPMVYAPGDTAERINWREYSDC
jgi:hypothetical protein